MRRRFAKIPLFTILMLVIFLVVSFGITFTKLNRYRDYYLSAPPDVASGTYISITNGLLIIEDLKDTPPPRRILNIEMAYVKDIQEWDFMGIYHVTREFHQVEMSTHFDYCTRYRNTLHITMLWFLIPTLPFLGFRLFRIIKSVRTKKNRQGFEVIQKM